LDLAREVLDPERFTLAVLGPVQAVEGVPATGAPRRRKKALTST
jgi:hypothetical protein